MVWHSYFPRLLQLETFKLCSSPEDDVDLTHSTLLTSATFYSIRFSDILLPWDAIRTLDLRSVSINVCLKLLFQCSNLRKYRIEDPQIPLEGLDFTVGQMVTLPYLEDLTWEHSLLEGDSSWNDLLYRFLDAPALSVLRWSLIQVGLADWELSPASLRRFFHRLPSTIRSLDIVTNIANLNPLELFPGHLQLGKLFLGSSDIHALMAAASVLNATDPNQEEDTVSNFTELEHLTITTSDPGFWTALGSAELATLLDGLSRRFETGRRLTIIFKGLSVQCNVDMLSERVVKALRSGDLVLRDDADDIAGTLAEAGITDNF
jgi:hypothetical protein